MKTPLEKHFDVVSGTRNRQARGFRFQELLRNLLIESRFEVHDNPRVARPRQSDLHASRDDLDYLIEAKWTGKRIDVSDIDDLRARLERTPGNIIGCLFSMSEFTPTAIDAVENNRQREILLFRPDEIKELVRSGGYVSELVKRKRKAFRIDGKVWFSGEKSRRASIKKFPFPEAGRASNLNSLNTECLEDRGTFHHVLFSSQGVEYTTPSGGGFRIEVTPQLYSVADLRNYLAMLHNQFGLSSEGSYTITQTGCHWHGFGVESFLKEAGRWRERYEKAQLNRIHHSEDLHYFDRCQSGVFLLTVRQRVGTDVDVHFHGCCMEIQLPGIPIDVRPFLRICEDASESFNYFVPVLDQESDRIHFREGIRLEPVAKIISKTRGEEQMVCGLVVKNPFFNKKVPLPEAKEPYSTFKFLDSTEHFICDMSDWHSLDDIADQYRLTRLEGVQIGSAIIFHPVCTWDNIVNRDHSDGEEIKALPGIKKLWNLSVKRASREKIMRLGGKDKEAASK